MRRPALGHELDVLEVGVHRAVDTNDGPLDDRAVLELDLDRLVDELGEEAVFFEGGKKRGMERSEKKEEVESGDRKRRRQRQQQHQASTWEFRLETQRYCKASPSLSSLLINHVPHELDHRCEGPCFNKEIGKMS